MSEQTTIGSPGGYQPGNPKAQARAEKAYRKAVRPFYKKKRFIIPVALVALVVIVSMAGGGGKSSTKTAAGPACTAIYPDKQSKDVCPAPGGSVTLSDLTVQASALAPAVDTLGGRALCSNVVITNKSSKSQDYNVLDFKIQTPAGVVATSSTWNLSSSLDSGTLVSGGVKQGAVCAEDKGERGQYVMIYKPNAFSSERGVWLNTV